MKGTIKKLKTPDEQYIYPITVSEAVYVDPKQNLTKKLSDLDAVVNAISKGATYVIDLDQWGIVPGLPEKPYSEADYLRADQNIQGINNALRYAHKHHFITAVLPKGDYSLCYPRPIRMVSHVTLHLSGSTLKVMYNSDYKSPFDDRMTADYYNFKGNSIVFEHVTNAHLIAGRLIGDRADRSWSNAAEEAKMEHTYGVVIGKGSSHCTVKHCEISDYMGDNVSFVNSTVKALVEFQQGLTLTGLSDTTGQDIASANSLTTKFLPLPKDVEYSSMMIAGAGYHRGTNLNSKDVDIFFYDGSRAFIGALKKRKIYTPISVPVGAEQFRIVFHKETNPNKYMQITIVFGELVHHNIVEHNEIYNGHRGGITGGGSYNVIQHNIIRDNGKNTLRFLDGLPAFPDPTRYAINQEDSFGDNCVIRNNLIYNSNHGILVGCYSAQIENNHIYNVDSIAINLYSLSHAAIRNNFIYNCGASVGIMTSNVADAYVHIHENSIYSGVTILNGFGYHLVVTENHFVNPAMIDITEGNAEFKNNRIAFSDTSASSTIAIEKAEGCIFDSSVPGKEIHFRIADYKRCVFRNIQANLRTRNELTVSEPVFLDDCKFFNSIMNNHAYLTKAKQVTVTRSNFEDSIIRVGNTNTENQFPRISLEDCILDVKSNEFVLLAESNRAYGTITLQRCAIDIANPQCKQLLRNTVTPASVLVSMTDCKLTYHGDIPLALQYYAYPEGISRFVAADNTFTNIVVPANPPGNFIGYNPESKGVAPPESGYFQVSHLHYNARPVAGGHVGWVCTAEGYAANRPWTSNTAYADRSTVYSSNKVYMAIGAGTSGTTAPFHTSGTWTDPNGVIWQYMGPRAVFTPFGSIAT